MALQIIASKVYAPAGSNVTVSAVKAFAGAAAAAPVVSTTGAPPAVAPFDVMQEYFHDGGSVATNNTLDIGISSAKFKAVTTSAEQTYWNANHRIVVYYCLAHDLMNNDAQITGSYPQTTDANYPARMAQLVASFGIANVYQLMAAEWDNDPGNNMWAQNRFVEAGSTRADAAQGITSLQAYTQWEHFYLAANHGGFVHHQLSLSPALLSQPYTTRGWKAKCNNVNAGTCHYSYEMGMDLVTLQRNNDDIGALIGAVGFIRGAGTQYGKYWGFDVSHWRTRNPSGSGATMFNSSGQLLLGWSTATYKRTYYLMYAVGTRVITPEGYVYTTNGTVNINGRLYDPHGVLMQAFSNYAFTRHPQRGTPHVPIAIMKEHIDWIEPRYGPFTQGRGMWNFQLTANAGANMMHNLLDLMYPGYNNWGTSSTVAEPWGSGRWGEQFDVITEKCSAAVMSANYPVVMLSVNTPMDATLQAKLNTFASGGGVVVINAKQLTGTAHETLTGVHLVGTALTSGVITWNSDSTTTTEPNFNHATVTLTTATVLAHSGASTPQVTKNVVGAGEVWTVMPDYMSNTANTATLGLATKIINVLISRFAAATISGGSHSNIDYAINKLAGTNGTTTTVTIINTNDPGGATWTGTVSAPGTGSPVPREWISDTNASFSVAAGQVNISASVPAGDVKVYAIVG